MVLADGKECRARARSALGQNRGNPGKLVLIHTGAVLLLQLAMILVDLFLQKQMDSTGGLGGVGTRSMLTTAQTVLRFAQTLLLPFWQVGYTYAALTMLREKNAEPGSLLEGFREFLPFLRLMLLQGVLYTGIGMLAINVGTMIFMMTPFSLPLLKQVAGENAMTADALYEALFQPSVLLPLLLIVGLIFLAVSFPFYYRFRMASYILLDSEKKGAFASLRMSQQMMRRNVKSLLKLDFSFWWFYALEFLVGILAYLDVILGLAGVKLPWSPLVMFLGTFCLSAVCTLAVHYFFRNQVAVTYAAAYQSLIPPTHAPILPRQPWEKV